MIQFDQAYAWIPPQRKKNNAMLAQFIRYFLKRKAGKSIAEWSLTDLETGKERLEKLAEFVDSAVREFRSNY